MSEEDSSTRETHRPPSLTELDQLSTMVHAEVRTPWIMLAILAFIVVGFSLLVFLYFRGAEEAEDQRDRIQALQTYLIGQQTAGEERLKEALDSVASIVAAERTVTQQIVRREVRAGPTQTVTKTARATVTETRTVIRPSGPPFLPSGCLEFAGVEVCRQDAAMGGLLLGLSLLGYVAIRRATP